MRKSIGTLLLLCAPALAAQELEPRSYSASPVGTSFIAAAWGQSSGNVVTDPTLPLSDVHATVENVALRYGHAFAIGNAQAIFLATMPYAWGWVSGKVSRPGGTVDSAITRVGVGDAQLKLSVNFIGSPALTPQQFAARKPSPWLVGASVAVNVPTGQYLPYQLVNVGTNRWAFKPEVGVSYNWHAKLYIDFYSGVWFFEPNQAFYPGANRRTQDPLWSLQFHASWNFTPRLYAALESTWYTGGASAVNGGPPSGRQDNSRLGALLSYGFATRQSLKLSYSTGASARVGQKFDTVNLAWTYAWF